MALKDRGDLTHEDIRFLKAVQDIEENPGKYPGTNLTEHPANTSVLKEMLDMSADMIRYRISPGERGLEDLGLVRLYDPELTDDGRMGPRSIALTDEGDKAIVDWEKRHGDLDADGWDTTTVEAIEIEISQIQNRLDQLDSQLTQLESGGGIEDGDGAASEERLQQLESRLDAIAGQVKEIKDDEFGALSQEKVRAFKNVDIVLGSYNALFDALGIEDHPKDISEAIDNGEFDPSEVRESVRESLGIDQEAENRTTNEGTSESPEPEVVDESQPEPTPKTTENGSDRGGHPDEEPLGMDEIREVQEEMDSPE